MVEPVPVWSPLGYPFSRILGPSSEFGVIGVMQVTWRLFIREGRYHCSDGEEKRQRTKQISPKGRLATNVHLLLQMMGCDEAKALPMPPRNILTDRV